MGWTNPWVIAAMAGGLALLAAFCYVETRVEHPMFRMELFRIRAFSAGNLAGLLSGLGRGGLCPGRGAVVKCRCTREHFQWREHVSRRAGRNPARQQMTGCPR